MHNVASIHMHNVHVHIHLHVRVPCVNVIHVHVCTSYILICCTDVSLGNGLPSWAPAMAIPFAILATILLFMDQQITALIVNRKDHKLKVGVAHISTYLLMYSVHVSLSLTRLKLFCFCLDLCVGDIYELNQLSYLGILVASTPPKL